MKKIVFFICMVMFILTSCTTSTNGIEYIEAQNYFHRNDAPLPQGLKITSQDEFEKHFSAATFMGENGKPTDIDFARSFVIAKVLSPTDKKTDLTPIKLIETGKEQLQLVYSLKTGEQQSYSTQPMFILVVNNKYKSYSIEEVVE